MHDGIVAPVAEKFSLLVHRADRDPTPGQLTVQIVRSLLEARVVVADLTGRNPNVYYELGVAHAFQLPVAILVDKATSLSFDTQNEKVIEIGDAGVIGVNQARDAVAQLTSVFNVILSDSYEVENLLTSVAAARSLDALAPDNPFASEVSAIREQLDEIHAFIRGEVRSRPSPAYLSMRRFIEAQANSGALGIDDLLSMADGETNAAFHEWVLKVVEMVPRGAPPPKYDYGDEPF